MHSSRDTNCKTIFQESEENFSRKRFDWKEINPSKDTNSKTQLSKNQRKISRVPREEEASDSIENKKKKKNRPVTRLIVTICR